MSNNLASVNSNTINGSISQASASYVSISPGTYYAYDPAQYCEQPRKSKSNNIELHLLNGQKIVKYIDWYKIYDLKELRTRRFRFMKKFPFVKTFSIPYTSFKYRTQYEYINSWLDTRYKVDCPLSAFMSLMGIDYEHFEEAVVEDAIKNGS